MINSTQVIKILSRATIEQKFNQINGALPALKTPFVDVGLDVGVIQASYRSSICAIVFGHQLHANIEELTAWKTGLVAFRGHDIQMAIGYLGGECGELHRCLVFIPYV